MKRSNLWVLAAVSLALAAQTIALFASVCATPVGVAVPESVATNLRGGDPEPVCNWLKTAECQEVVRSSDLSTCPAQTYYYQDGQDSQYLKNDGSDYCGTQREGDPQIYDCTSVTIDVVGCVK